MPQVRASECVNECLITLVNMRVDLYRMPMPSPGYVDGV